MIIPKNHQRSLGVIMDDIESINPHKDTTLGIINTAQQNGWNVIYFDYDSIALYNQQAVAEAKEITIDLNKSEWYQLGEKKILPLNSQTAILMRKDPPINNDYLYVCRILEFVQRAGCRVFNDPTGIIGVNEKIMAQEFSAFCVPTIISKKYDQLIEFVKKYKHAVIKPLNDMGGTNVFKVENDNKSYQLIKEMCQADTHRVLIQQLIPEYSEGDKRILLINGVPIPYALNRIPPEGQLRANLAAGGVGEVVELNQTDIEICQSIKPRLEKLGLLFVGIDIIGNKLTEINVTSPTCARQIENTTGYTIFDKWLSAIEDKLSP